MLIFLRYIIKQLKIILKLKYMVLVVSYLVAILFDVKAN